MVTIEKRLIPVHWVRTQSVFGVCPTELLHSLPCLWRSENAYPRCKMGSLSNLRAIYSYFKIGNDNIELNSSFSLYICLNTGLHVPSDQDSMIPVCKLSISTPLPKLNSPHNKAQNVLNFTFPYPIYSTHVQRPSTGETVGFQ